MINRGLWKKVCKKASRDSSRLKAALYKHWKSTSRHSRRVTFDIRMEKAIVPKGNTERKKGQKPLLQKTNYARTVRILLAAVFTVMISRPLYWPVRGDAKCASPVALPSASYWRTIPFAILRDFSKSHLPWRLRVWTLDAFFFGANDISIFLKTMDRLYWKRRKCKYRRYFSQIVRKAIRKYWKKKKYR